MGRARFLEYQAALLYYERVQSNRDHGKPDNQQSEELAECWIYQEVTKLKQKAVVLNLKDNVATALADIKAGDIVKLEVGEKTQEIKLTTDIPFGHKFSLSKIELNSPVIKYGEVIGMSSATIEPGDYVHIHNVVSTRGRGDLEGGKE